MPTNKNAQLRYQVLDRCLSNWSRRYYIEDLVEACNEALYQYNGETKDGGGVKKRQVQEDLKFIESEEGYGMLIEQFKMVIASITVITKKAHQSRSNLSIKRNWI